jgi:Tol biopolymer transport system component
MSSRSRRAVLLGAALCLATAIAVPVHAATPGKNGKVLWVNDGAIVVTDLAGTLPSDGTILVQASQSPSDPRWSPDGGRFVFTARAEDDTIQVFVMDADGSDLRQVTDVCRADDPDWSSDAQWIIFAQYRCDNSSERIVRIRLDGTGLTPITSFQTDRYDYEPVASPDGRRIAFSSGPTGDDLMFANPWKPASDANNRTLWRPNAYNQTFSPDGKRLAFRFNEDSVAHYGIRTIAAGPVTELDAGDFLEISPNGIQLTYSVNVSGAYQLWMRRLDGTGSPILIGPATGTSTTVPLPHIQPVCSIKGDNKANTLTGTAANELICGRGGNDTISGKGGLDIVFAGPGNDTVKGGDGPDVLVGELGNDRLDGQKGTDRCVQGPGTGALISC